MVQMGNAIADYEGSILAQEYKARASERMTAITVALGELDKSRNSLIITVAIAVASVVVGAYPFFDTNAKEIRELEKQKLSLEIKQLKQGTTSDHLPAQQ